MRIMRKREDKKLSYLKTKEERLNSPVVRSNGVQNSNKKVVERENNLPTPQLETAPQMIPNVEDADTRISNLENALGKLIEALQQPQQPQANGQPKQSLSPELMQMAMKYLNPDPPDPFRDLSLELIRSNIDMNKEIVKGIVAKGI